MKKLMLIYAIALFGCTKSDFSDPFTMYQQQLEAQQNAAIADSLAKQFASDTLKMKPIRDTRKLQTAD